MRIGAIILLGGRGERFAAEVPKQFLKLSGKKVYLHTVEQFLRADQIDAIVCVCPESYVDQVRQEVPQSVQVCSGGRTRQESSLEGLRALGPCDYVLIHDAVRPFVTQRIIDENIRLVQQFDAVDTCIPTTDTMVHSLDGQLIHNIPNRAHYFRGQTPQTFRYDLILKAHETSTGDEATDDCSLVRQMGHPVAIATGSESNIKITHLLDLYIAEQLLRLQTDPTSYTSKSIANKHYVVTGGSGEIGKAICETLEAKGARVTPLSKQIHGDLSCAKTAKEIFEGLGEVDGVINCVGYLVVKPLSEMNDVEVQTTLAANLTAPVNACRFAQIKHGGDIINISSSAYSRGRKNYAIYSATKAALVNFTQGLALERPDLDINVLAPSRTRSPMRSSNFPNETDDALLEPLDIAHEVVHLLQSAAITGTTREVRKETTRT